MVASIRGSKTKSSFLYLATHDKSLLATDEFQFIVERTDTDDITGKSIARDILIKSQGRGAVQFECRLNTKKVVQSGRLPQTTDWL